ncbi:hypothetical protein [uncultured Nitrosomonas sp.]|uniref:hypothetical protein n=1 Tax=uncultured Nitrosomonas sp. TaxID=156424 RepID=UPI0026011A35|nr:hypothetical protein [uncultured Nitrosomonas sp.]
MTKFKEFDNDQKSAFKELLFIVMERRIKEEIEYTNHVFKFLVLGNGAGIALLAAFMGAIAATGNPISELVSPLWKFLIGATLAAFIYVPLFAVASQATIHAANQISDFFQNKLDFEEIGSWSLNRKGLIIVQLLALTSLILFFWGVYQCISILEKF